MVKMPAFLKAKGKLRQDFIDMIALIMEMSDRQIAHILRRQDDAIIAAMIRTLALSCIDKHGKKGGQ